MSLKQTLLDYLKTHGRMSLNELAAICAKHPAKISAAEKRLRELREPLHPSFCPSVGVIREKGYIVAYTWKTTVLDENMHTQSPLDGVMCLPNSPCFSKQKFNICNCEKILGKNIDLFTKR